MNDIHPLASVSGDVRLGERNTIGAFAVITGPVTIGDDNWIGAGVVIGAPPEVRSFTHPRSPSDAAGGGVIIGNRNVVREYAQIHHGWKAQTRVGDDAFVMNQCYIAHDCEVGDRVTLASSVLLAGHVQVRDDANLGLSTSVHQFREIGRGTMVGMGSVVTKDAPPYSKVYGNPAEVRGANVVGMQRSGVPAEVIGILTRLFDPTHAADPHLADRLRDHIEDDAVRTAIERWAERER